MEEEEEELYNMSHPLHGTLTSLSSSFSERLRHLLCVTEVPQDVAPSDCQSVIISTALTDTQIVFFCILLYFVRLSSLFLYCTIIFALCCCNTANFPSVGLIKDSHILSYLDYPL